MADNTLAAAHTTERWAIHPDAPFEIVLDDGDVCPLIATVNSEGCDPARAKSDARRIALTPELLAQLKIARKMLANYAAYDERHGIVEDAAYTRRRLVDIDATICAAEQDFTKCPDCDGTGMALNAIGEPDTCKACRGDTVVAAAKAGPANV